MITVSDDHLVGASTWQQSFFDALAGHERDEQDMITSYEEFADTAPSESVRDLVNLIVDDEKRHHRILNELANTMRARATFEKRQPRVPYLDVLRRDDELLAETNRFLELEHKDRAELKRMARKVRMVGGELDAFIIDLLQSDTDRHIRILRFIKSAIRNSPVP